jgi:polyhydroxyalkanoate synthesis regulator phasin
MAENSVPVDYPPPFTYPIKSQRHRGPRIVGCRSTRDPFATIKKETPMFDLVRKSMLAGVGLALKAWDEVEDLAKEVAEQSKMTEKEGRKFIDELQDRYEDAQKKLEERVEKSVKELLKKADVVTQDELKGLKKEIRDLKKLISSQGGEEKP